MSTAARKRLIRDFKRLQADPPEGVNASPQAENIMQWNAIIFGPDGTVSEAGSRGVNRGSNRGSNVARAAPPLLDPALCA